MNKGTIYTSLVRLRQRRLIKTPWGIFAEQPPGQVLLADPGGWKGAGGGGGELGPGRR